MLRLTRRPRSAIQHPWAYGTRLSLVGPSPAQARTARPGQGPPGHGPDRNGCRAKAMVAGRTRPTRGAPRDAPRHAHHRTPRTLRRLAANRRTRSPDLVEGEGAAASCRGTTHTGHDTRLHEPGPPPCRRQLAEQDHVFRMFQPPAIPANPSSPGQPPRDPHRPRQVRRRPSPDTETAGSSRVHTTPGLVIIGEVGGTSVSKDHRNRP